MKCSSLSCRVHFVSTVIDRSGFRSVVICVLVFLFPVANLYTSFQELFAVMLQYSIRDLFFLPFDGCCILCFFHCSIVSYAILSTDHCASFFGISYVQHLLFSSVWSLLPSTTVPFYFLVLSLMPLIFLNGSLHAVFTSSLNSSMDFSI
jgi:hypothetical protein